MPRTKKDTAAATVAETVKETTAPAEEKKAATKRTAAKTTATKSAAKPAAKKAAVVENIFIQQNGSEVTATDLVEKAKADAGIKAPKKVDIYVRPEINMVYYVINGEKFGSFELC